MNGATFSLPPGTTVAVTEAPEGVPATAMGRFATDDLHTVTYSPGPVRRREAGVAMDLLEALGKSRNVTGKSRHATTESELATLWLNAHGTRVLIATACQHAPAPDLLALTEMCAATPTAVVFAVDHGYGPDLLEALRPVAPQQVPWPDLPEASGDDTDSEPPSGGVTVAPLPPVEYWTFYATAKRLLTDDRFAHVHDLYCDAHARVTGWLYDVQAAGRDVTVDRALAVFRTLAEEHTDTDEITVVTRAAQAAFHNAGWVATVDDRELRAATVRHIGTPNQPGILRRLRAYREPARAATVALYLSGATPAAIQAVTVDDLAQWAHQPDLPVATVAVPSEASPYLRGALLARAHDGADPSDPAFPGSERRVGLNIKQAATDLGLSIGNSRLSATSTVNQKRLPRNLVKLERIT